MNQTRTLITFLLIVIAINAMAHGGKKHKKDSTQKDSVVVVDSASQHHHDHAQNDEQKTVKADLDDFPSLHPLIVHFAIVLIIIAAALQLVNILLLRKEFSWIIAGLVTIGFITAYLASTKFHPHTHNLSEHAKQVLAQHDLYADWTLYLAGIAAILQLLNLFLLKLNRLAVIAIAVIMASASYCVIHAGHYGAQLVHIEGVGPQGKHLEQHHDH